MLIPIDMFSDSDISLYQMRKYSTTEVAKMLGIHQSNLQRSIRQKRLSAPPIVKVGRLRIRLWSKADVETARKEMSKRKG